MLIDGLRDLDRFGRRHPDAREPLEQWIRVTLEARWQNILEVREDFPAADAIPVRTRGGRVATVTCFDIGGNKHRLLTLISYRAEAVDVVEVLTHAEYNTGRWKKRVG